MTWLDYIFQVVLLQLCQHVQDLVKSSDWRHLLVQLFLMVSGNLSDSLLFCLGEFFSHYVKSNFRLAKIFSPCLEMSTGMVGRGIDVTGLLLPHQGLDLIQGDQGGRRDLAQGGLGDLAQGGQGGLHRQGFQNMF